MKLYHGTSESAAKLILEQGFQPRKETTKSCWDKTIPSNESCVYLTSCYAGFFALNASNNERWAVLEIETSTLDTELFVPDEDGLEQLTRDIDFHGLDIYERTEFFKENLLDYHEYWPQVLERLGNCAYYAAIPASAITAVSFFDAKQNPAMEMAWMDPSISVLNHQFCNQKYEALTQWLFGVSITPEEFTGFPVLDAEHATQILQLLEKTSGLEVHRYDSSNTKRIGGR